MTSRLVRGAMLGALAMAAVPKTAGAQSTSVVTSSVAVAAIYDENVLWRPVAQSDHLWRVTPSVDYTRDSTRSRWRLEGLFDAEWYSRFRALSTPGARYHASTTWDFRPTTADRLGLTAGYDNSFNPSQFNVGTGLFLGRTRGWRWFASPEYIKAVTPQTSLVSTYRLTGEFAARGAAGLAETGALTNAGEFGVATRLSERNEIWPSYLAELYQFRGAGSHVSHRGFLRWIHRLSPLVRVELGGGVRIAEARFTPAVDVRISRRAGFAEAGASYTFDRVTTIGVAHLVEVHSALASASFRKPELVDAWVTGGLYRSGSGADHATVYRVAAELRFPVAKPLYMALGSSVDYQRGRLGVPVREPFDLSEVPSDQMFVVPPAPSVRRTTLMVSFVVLGTTRSASGPRELEPRDGDRLGELPGGRRR